MIKNPTRRILVPAALLCSLLLAVPADAACNTGGCWSAQIDFMKIDTSGRIWFVVTDSSSLDNLIPPDGCNVVQIWTGAAERALYVRPDDPDRDEKYSLLLTAFTTGKRIGFSPIKDNATGWCSLKEIDVRL